MKCPLCNSEPAKQCPPGVYRVRSPLPNGWMIVDPAALPNTLSFLPKEYIDLRYGGIDNIPIRDEVA